MTGDKTDDYLKQSGWYAGRKVEIDKIKSMYDLNGYTYNQLQINFISEYAYLKIVYKHPLWNQNVELSMEPVIAQKTFDMEVVKEYESYFNEKFLIIGEIERENMSIFIDSNGEFYGAYDDCVIKWGNDFHKMLYNLVNGIKGELVIIE